MVASSTTAGTWNELKGRVRAKWGAVTDDMLEECKGNMQALVGKIQRTTGERAETIQEFLNSGANKAATLYERATEAVRTGTEAITNKVSEEAKYVGDSVKQGAAQAGQLVQARPMESLSVTFIAGVAAGLALALAMTSKPKPSGLQAYMPDLSGVTGNMESWKKYFMDSCRS